MRLSRRSLLQWAIGVAAGTVLARTPMAGALTSTEGYAPGRQFQMFGVRLKDLLKYRPPTPSIFWMKHPMLPDDAKCPKCGGDIVCVVSGRGSTTRYSACGVCGGYTEMIWTFTANQGDLFPDIGKKVERKNERPNWA